MRLPLTVLLLVPILSVACVSNPDKRTLSSLRRVQPDLTDVQVEVGLEQALVGYRKFLDQAPPSSLTPEAMRRLADLQLEKEYGHLGAVQNQAGIFFCGKTALDDLVGGLYHLSQHGLVLDDGRVVIHVGGAGNTVGEGCQQSRGLLCEIRRRGVRGRTAKDNF